MRQLHHKHVNPPPSRLLILLLCFALIFQPNLVQASVNDNVSSTKINQTLGNIDDTSSANSIVGLIRLVIETLGEIKTSIANLDVKIDAQTKTLQESMKNTVVAATASYNLYVYLPKSDACQQDYTDATITIYSSSGNQSATSKLECNDTNYYTTLYFNFSGACQLHWTARNSYGDTFDITEDVNITNASQEFKLGSVAHRLYVYFPKSVELKNNVYKDKPITLTQNGKSFASTLRLVGGNKYEATIYSDFDGVANLSYNFYDETGAATPIEEPVTMSGSKMTQEIGLNSMDPSLMSWRTIHTICQSNRASLFFEEGDILPDDFMIIGMRKYNGKDSLQIFRTKSIGRMDWNSAKSAAQSYCLTFNSEIAGFNMAYMSDLLTKSDLESGYFADSAKRCVADAWWTNTPCSTYQINYNSYGYNVMEEGTNSYYHLFVVTWANGSLGANVAGFTGDYNTNPYLWIY